MFKFKSSLLVSVILFSSANAMAQAAPNGYQTQCEPMLGALFTSDLYTHKELIIGKKGEQAAFKAGVYLDASCETPLYIIDLFGKVKSISKAFPARVQDLRIAVEQQFVSTGSADIVEALNAQAFCGVTDWEVSKQKDLRALKCTSRELKQLGKVQLVRLKIENITEKSVDLITYAESDFGKKSIIRETLVAK